MAPKKEYEERGPDETGTPLERFKRALSKVMSVPKAKVEERERQLKRRETS